ncbi:1-aminocyclopropane-1-carboxylate deaminase/D-cysteine desulfhydrase [Neobacillus cucumis]|uniref:1-aminocyclopropane-1-carboxylate deaminase n=1 Tax=Neobacillus cucumis TaxID=1740721 RepID=A0A2N5H6H9_9BACI|nr:pyridoxal-phosphate dependent enzyme [Neobacillus cucumis]PLS01108.1 1-aminocyclopropane-1-carboxylate deaminase [Neobacillus cucumis]
MEEHFSPTQIHKLNYSDGLNDFYIKREDLLPFSFGGNKVRFASEYFKDMKRLNYDCIISYGNSRSNLNRIIANMSKVKNIPCYVISPADESGERIETNNSRMVKNFGVTFIPCKKENVSQTVSWVLNECKSNGLKPYYIYGDIYGKGNEKVAIKAYVEVYNEILEFEKDSQFSFDYIFLASATGTTQSGLICGRLLNGDNRQIVGISIARKKANGKEIILNNIREYLKGDEVLFKEEDICFEDKYVVDGYGEYNIEIIKVIKDILNTDGIPLDPTYTGKAFWGMREFLKQKKIEGKKILFMHTGGTPLFFDYLNKINVGTEDEHPYNTNVSFC